MDASILTTLVGTVVTLIGMLVIAARLRAALKREIQGLGTGLTGSIQELGTGLKGSIQGLETSIQGLETDLKREIQGARDAARQMDDRIRLLIDIIITHKGPAPDVLPSRPRTATGPPPEEDL